MAKISFAKLQQKYGGMYVLTDKPDGKVVTASRNLGKAFKEAEKKDSRRPQYSLYRPTALLTSMKSKFPYGISSSPPRTNDRIRRNISSCI